MSWSLLECVDGCETVDVEVDYQITHLSEHRIVELEERQLHAVGGGCGTDIFVDLAVAAQVGLELLSAPGRRG